MFRLLPRAGVLDQHQTARASVHGVDVGDAHVPPLVRALGAQGSNLRHPGPGEVGWLEQLLLLHDPKDALAIRHPPPVTQHRAYPAIHVVRMGERHLPDRSPESRLVWAETRGILPRGGVEDTTREPDKASHPRFGHMGLRHLHPDLRASSFPSGEPSKTSRKAWRSRA